DRTVEIVREALDLGMPVAAQRRSVYTLAVAGALEGRQYACEKPIPTWIIEDEGGSTYSGTGVVQDGNVITSGTGPYRARMTGEPDGTTELTQLFMNALG
ncbi:MAG: DJ-1/PfpI family protein, partial [Acidimicrobiia bacterium]|nr:DJ-1/PfpI family protein [Acidimicrobiia bacterium]